MGRFILSMLCVSDDEVQVAIHRREDIARWLKTLDHEGSSWSVVVHEMDGDVVVETRDITTEIIEECGQ